jgi:hypothetical protein
VSLPRALVLYGTSACHLCEQAEQLLLPWVGLGWQVEWVDIADDDALLERFGVSIPVLQRTDDVQLAWPFDAETIALFLKQVKG